MNGIDRDRIEQYLEKAFGQGARLLAAGDLGNLDEQGMKGFGYGKPLLVRFSLDGEEREAVFSVMKGDKYGHQYLWDRASVLMFQYFTSDRLERHVRPLGLGYVDEAGELVPVRGLKEFFIVNEKLEGHDYFLDLDRIAREGLSDGDLHLAADFARWLARVHSEKKQDRDLYWRRIRNLIGSDECILGLIDEAYPEDYAAFPRRRFEELEAKLVRWRWKLKEYHHRLSAVHGDFHPWNVLVNGSDFRVLDRSRGEWGEPGGDLCTMAINYLLWSLRSHGRLEGDFKKLYDTYFETYISETGDTEVFDVMAPFIVFRALVIASPEWYPDHAPEVRRGLFNLMENVLDEETFDWADVNRYME
ncbi:phosphotransferase family protein [Desulfovibrio oxyclinae]|jgi:hypothetical protein|uniref:phosphotransferase family protein n=1 Tax=Desulfovibrio oxyclinae TaxID=63560 RepID=UPI000376882D|nr:phosphotransferase [Desulfovibrio oxyclinae]